MRSRHCTIYFTELDNGHKVKGPRLVFLLEAVEKLEVDGIFFIFEVANDQRTAL